MRIKKGRHTCLTYLSLTRLNETTYVQKYTSFDTSCSFDKCHVSWSQSLNCLFNKRFNLCVGLIFRLGLRLLFLYFWGVESGSQCMGILCPYFTPQRMVQLTKRVRKHLVTFIMKSVYLVSAVISWEPKQFTFMDVLKSALHNNETIEPPLFGSDLISSKTVFYKEMITEKCTLQ